MRLFTGIEAIRAQIGQSSKTLPDSVYCPNWSNEGEYWINITLVGHSGTSYPHSMPVFIGIYGLHLADSLAHQNLFDRIVMQQVEIQPSLMALYSCMSSSEMDYYDLVLVGEAVQRAKEAQGPPPTSEQLKLPSHPRWCKDHKQYEKDDPRSDPDVYAWYVHSWCELHNETQKFIGSDDFFPCVQDLWKTHTNWPSTLRRFEVELPNIPIYDSLTPAQRDARKQEIKEKVADNTQRKQELDAWYTKHHLSLIHI